MAAEDDGAQDDKPAGSAAQGRERRQRQPVTIDLTAERVSAGRRPTRRRRRPRRPNAATAKPEAPSRTKPPPPARRDAAAEDRRTTAADPTGRRPRRAPKLAARRQHHRQRRRLDAHGARRRGGRHRRADPAPRAAGHRPVAVAGPHRPRSQAAEQAKAANEAVAALDRRVSAVEMITQNLPARPPSTPSTARSPSCRRRWALWRRRAISPRSTTSSRRFPRRWTALPPGREPRTISPRSPSASRGWKPAAPAAMAARSIRRRWRRCRAASTARRRASRRSASRLAALEEGWPAAPTDSTLAARAIAVVALRRAATRACRSPPTSTLPPPSACRPDDVAALKPWPTRACRPRRRWRRNSPTSAMRSSRATTKANPDAGFFERIMAGAACAGDACGRPGRSPATIRRRSSRACAPRSRPATSPRRSSERDGLPHGGQGGLGRMGGARPATAPPSTG